MRVYTSCSHQSKCRVRSDALNLHSCFARKFLPRSNRYVQAIMAVLPEESDRSYAAGSELSPRAHSFASNAMVQTSSSAL
jgi:hypothetical protein